MILQTYACQFLLVELQNLHLYNVVFSTIILNISNIVFSGLKVSSGVQIAFSITQLLFLDLLIGLSAC